VNIYIAMAVVIVAVISAVTDLRFRKIPNWLSLSAALTGLLLNFFFSGFQGLGSALVGSIAGFLLLFFVYLVGGMGAGDVKLMAAIGAFLGPWLIFVAFIWTALAGGVLALLLIGWRKTFRQTSQNLKTILLSLSMGTSPRQANITLDNPKLIKLPYGVPIALGTILAVWVRDIPRFGLW
jgi:prepilin peptidase CpaA